MKSKFTDAQAKALAKAPEFEFAGKLVNHYRFNPNDFANDILQVGLDPWQIEANDSVADYVRWAWRRDMKIQTGLTAKNYFTVSAMHGPGKTFWGATLIHWFGTCFRMARIPCFAPKMEQLTTRLWPELRKVRMRAIPAYQAITDSKATTLNWCGDPDWCARAYTASTAENLAGLHHDHQLAFCDEASGIKEEFWPVIHGALSTGAIQILVIISNPTKNTGTFANSWLKPNVAKDYHQVKITLDKAPRVSRKWVKMLEDSLGKDSPIVKIRAYGEFAAMSSSQLISPGWIADARDRAELNDHTIGDGSIAKLRVSVDVADGGTDKSVITVMKHYSSMRFLMRQRSYSFPTGEAPLRIAEEAIRLFHQFGGNVKRGDDIVIDSLGVGAGGAGRLMESDMNTVIYKGGSSSDNADMWRNRRVQSYMNLRNDLRDGYLIIMPDAMQGEFAGDEGESVDPWDEFDAQLCSIETRNDQERVEDLVTRSQMAAQGLKSPDRADSLAMQYATQAPSYMRREIEMAVGTKALTVVRSRAREGFIG